MGRNRPGNPAKVVVLALAFVLALSSASAVYPEQLGILWARGGQTGWDASLLVDGAETEASDFQANTCQVGPSPRVTIPAKGGAYVADLGALQCAPGSWGVLTVDKADAPGAVVTRFVYRPTGATMFVPPANRNDQTKPWRVGGLRNEGEDAAFVLIHNEGHAGVVRFTVYDGQALELARQVVMVDEGLNFVRVVQPFPVGSVILEAGYSDGSFAPGGQLWAWGVSGPFTNASASRAVPFSEASAVGPGTH